MSAKKRLKEEDILAVHKALSEAKVPTEDRYVGFFIPDGYMTGPEWFQKFEKEVRKLDLVDNPEDWLDGYKLKTFLEAAKRASNGEK